MRKKLVAGIITWAAGAGLTVFVGMTGTAVPQAAAKSTATNTQVTEAAAHMQVVPGTPEGILRMQAQALFGKLPQVMPGGENDTPAMVALGEKLYFEKNISINRTQSCNSCHPIDNNSAGADNLKTGRGAEGKFGDRNDPPTMNAGFQVAQFWDGRAGTLEEQCQGPPLNPIEMGMPDAAAVVKRLKDTDGYNTDFAIAFPGQKNPVTFDNFAKAIAAFERTLISRGRFDQFIEGDSQALNPQETEGMRVFIETGCVQCHSGPNLGGMTYQKMGVFHEYPNDADVGRFKVTQREADKYVFKVPMLRNVTLTAPYFHDGQVGSLAEAVDLMAYLQLNKVLQDAEINSMLRFVTTLADAERTTAPGIDKKSDAAWAPVHSSEMPQGAQGDLVRYGELLLTKTYALLGPGAKDPAMRYSGNGLNCTSCHQDNGTKKFGLPWMGVSQMYPQYRAREDQEQGLEARINGCFERSLNGKALPVKSREMKAMVAYIDWLSEDMPKNVDGLGTPKFEGPNRRADLVSGEAVYARACMSCHGENGEGYQSMSSDASGNYVAPALWGPNSYNNGAGMNRLLTAAAFVHSNMPLGTQWNHPAVSKEDAYDVAGYLSSKQRPQMSGLEKDYPKLEKKAVDCPYPPYADSFPQDQHQYGPFQPIKEARKK
jgi:cytochrome c peroxidase